MCCFLMDVDISQQEQQIEIIDNEGRQKQVKEDSYGSCEYTVGIPRPSLLWPNVRGVHHFGTALIY